MYKFQSSDEVFIVVNYFLGTVLYFTHRWAVKWCWNIKEQSCQQTNNSVCQSNYKYLPFLQLAHPSAGTLSRLISECMFVPDTTLQVLKWTTLKCWLAAGMLRGITVLWLWKKKEYQKDENTLVSLAHLFKDFEVSVNIFYEPKSALIGPEQSVFFISNVRSQWWRFESLEENLIFLLWWKNIFHSVI